MKLTKFKNRKNYYLVFKVDGVRVRRSTGCTNKSDALKWLSNFEKNTEKQKLEKIVSLNDFRKDYESYCKNKNKPTTNEGIKTTFNLLEKSLGNPMIKEITPKMLDEFITTTFKRSQYSSSLCYRNLKAAFNVAIRWNYLKTNPFNGIKRPKIEKKLPVFIPENEFDLIVEHTEKEYLRDLFITAYNTGLRASELVNMKWSWINMEEKIITVKHNETFSTKGNAERQIPMNNILYKTLETRKLKVINFSRSYKDDYVFFRIIGVALTVDNCSKSFKKICRKLNLTEKYHLHSLRHGFASRLVQNNVDLLIVQTLLGHKDLKTTQIYTHLKNENLVHAVNKLNKKVI